MTLSNIRNQVLKKFLSSSILLKSELDEIRVEGMDLGKTDKVILVETVLSELISNHSVVTLADKSGWVLNRPIEQCVSQKIEITPAVAHAIATVINAFVKHDGLEEFSVDEVDALHISEENILSLLSIIQLVSEQNETLLLALIKAKGGNGHADLVGDDGEDEDLGSHGFDDLGGLGGSSKN